MTADLHHLAAAYSLNALDDVERTAYEEHYPSCEICAAEVHDFRSVASSLAASAATTPPPSLKASVLSEITQTRQLSPLVDRSSPAHSINPVQNAQPSRWQSAGGRKIVLAAAAALVVLAGIAVALRPADTGDSFDEVVSSDDAVVLSLSPSSETQPGNLQVVWSNDLNQVAIIGSGLDDVDADQAYALWFLLDDGVAPAGLFRPEAGTITTVLNVDDIDALGWGITIEPDTGSPQPTSDVIFAGSL
jgi:anti-sigma-K factor RskA